MVHFYGGVRGSFIIFEPVNFSQDKVNLTYLPKLIHNLGHYDFCYRKPPNN